MKRKKKKNKENLVCFVHYPNKDESKYINIKEISAINEERIRLVNLNVKHILTKIFIENSVHLFQTRSIMINMVYI